MLDDANAKVEEYEASIAYVDDEITKIDRKLDGSEQLEMTEETFFEPTQKCEKTDGKR